MDFEIAERKLKSEQSKLRSKHRAAARRTNATSNNTTRTTTRRYAPALSYAAQRQAEEQKKLNEKRLKEAEKKRQVKAGLEQYVKSCERMLSVSSLRSALDATTTTVTKAANRKINPNKLFLQGTKYTPTSIYGQGDKITLPPSVLSQLAKEEGFGSSNNNGGSPITFRVGILNPRYGSGNDNDNGDCEFPSSEAMKRKMEELTLKYSSHDDDDKHQQDDSDDDMDDDDNDAEFTKAYREELSHRYISYTHATVVEFTQEDGHIGLPSPIASALLDCNENRETCVIPTTKTVDPSSCLSTTNTTTTTTTAPEEEETTTTTHMDIEEEKTPGHLAWGAFEIPDTEIEILMVKLPKGKRCTLTPTRDAVENGFYGLKDVKLVLEQSLIRTRATLSLNDTVHTWHRGVKFDLKVSSVEPSEFSAVSCINTDIEVDIGVPEYIKEEANKNEETESVATAKDQKEKEEKSKKNGFAAAGTGRSLMDPSPSQTQQTQQQQQSQSTASKQPLSTPLEKDLPPEPPASQTTNICTIQICNERGQTVGSRRRFDTLQNTMSHLFAYAASALKEKEEEDASSSFHLVTRFPRIVFSLNDENKDLALGDCGVKGGQMMFFVERG